MNLVETPAAPGSAAKSRATVEGHFKGYYVVTWRCPLSCDYCFRDTSPASLARELDLAGKKALVSHLYHRLGFRQLALSGGEPIFMGARPPEDFLSFARFLRMLKSPEPGENLHIELYSNGIYLSERVADALVGAVDLVAMTIDGAASGLLQKIGRSTQEHGDYLERTVRRCRSLTERGITIKLHSVVGALNCGAIAEDVRVLYGRLEDAGARISKWKFYQYMTYDDPVKDRTHAISEQLFEDTAGQIYRVLEGSSVALHFKANTEMRESFFNILHDGTGQYMLEGDTWSTSRRTDDLRRYDSMAALFQLTEINEPLFRRYHELAV